MRISNKILFEEMCNLEFHMQELLEMVASMKVEKKDEPKADSPKRGRGRPRKNS